MGSTISPPARVRFIGEPEQRIAEDHLRILRFFRFHARFGRGAPDPASYAACVARAKDLMALSRERIAAELLKLLGVADPVATVGAMLAGGLFVPVLPEIVAADRLAALVASETAAGIAPDGLRRLAALLPLRPTSRTASAAGCGCPRRSASGWCWRRARRMARPRRSPTRSAPNRRSIGCCCTATRMRRGTSPTGRARASR